MKSGAAEQEALDVIVLGAGNVGLAAALLLARQSLRVAVIDRRPLSAWQPAPGFDARVYALNPAVQSMLATLGVWSALDAARIGTIAAMEVHGDAGGALHFGDRGPPLARVVEDGALQAALAAALDARLGPGWLRVAEPVALRITSDRAILDCAAGAPLAARLIVGADGARSWLRDQMPCTVKLRDYQRAGVVANFACERPHDGIARQWFDQGEVIALLPLGGDHISLVWSAREGLARRLLDGPPGGIAAALADRIGTPLGQLSQISTAQAFPLRLLKVDTLCGPRTVLVGDAAHGVHPLAGQGLNLGLADAVCLSETIATRGAGPDPGDRAVLRRHARRRAEPTLAMQWVTDGLHRLFDVRDPLTRRIRNLGLDLVDRAPLLKSLLAGGAAGQDNAGARTP
jgi:ubiquinone biosynthesis UbiH/UbiF/VisC/COQ6 family hydroxylase